MLREGRLSGETVGGPRTPANVALATIAVGLTVFVTWCWFAPLASAINASGVVVVGRHNSVVQHPEGGVVAQVLVREGAEVQAGDPLVVLDGEKARSAQRSYLEQFAANTFQIARLEAEQAEALKLVIPETSDGVDLAAFHNLADFQADLFDTRRLVLRSKLQVLALQRLQAEDAIHAAEIQLGLAKFRVESVTRDLGTARSLFSSHDSTYDKVAALERTVVELRAAEAEQQARIEGGHRKAELENGEIQKTLVDSKVAIVNDLQRARAERPELRERLDLETLRVSHLVVAAPTAGKVSGLNVHTAGSVLGPGQVVAEIVPQNDDLEIDAHIKPEDISYVRPGLPVDVSFPALGARRNPRMTGHVSIVSPDRTNDKISGQPYFEVRIECDQDSPGLIDARPGMSAEVWINSGSRSVAQYLAEPFTKFMHSGLREQ